MALLLLLQPIRLAAAAAPTGEPAATQADRIRAAGSYQVAPVRILGIPALVVASPQLHGDGAVVEARRRAELIEGNLRLLYEPRSLCTTAEWLSEEMVEGVLGGPRRQRLCSGDHWGLLGRAEDLQVETEPLADGEILLQARLPGRTMAIPLLTVTAADAQLHGLSTTQLAADWRQMLERRLRHARRIMQPALLELRVVIALVVELLLAASTARSLWLWSRSRRALRRHQLLARTSKDLQSGRARRLQTTSRLLVSLTLVQLVVMLGFGLAAVPGRVPLAVAVLLQPLSMLLKAALVAAVAWLLRQLLHVLLWQWLGTMSVPFVQRARREQRYRNLLQVGRRLINLAGLIVLVVWVIAGWPGLDDSPVAAWLASGAVLGALALVFQGLLRDFVAGLVVLFDDHYAVGDYVEIDGVGGDVEDVGVLATVLRTLDQRVVVLRNSRLEMLVNHTKLRSGVELTLPLAPGCPRLDVVVDLVQQECSAFAADPAWNDNLLEAPIVRA
ncbi:mechanosensitive ion channel family protein [Synechococcus sp. GFB01]|uniref:mechanosensitive ion channel family protein n=1 Tax=Synechococcus sp. GFB01 TaxID=1662190 RepID=UPI001F1AF237|nr:mechanosensitive ion channel domain-containing protein [Synechococcus sp. GFB01]